jgi:hypothetical protein
MRLSLISLIVTISAFLFSVSPATAQRKQSRSLNQNATRICSQIRGQTVDQIVQTVNKDPNSPVSYTLRKCPLNSNDVYGIGGDVEPGSVLSAPPPSPSSLGRYYQSSPRGGFWGR